MSGQETTKNNSSRNSVIIISAVPLPKLMPSRFMNIIAMLLPPTAVGVMAEVNSHSIHTLNDCDHDKSPSVSRLYRHI